MSDQISKQLETLVNGNHCSRALNTAAIFSPQRVFKRSAAKLSIKFGEAETITQQTGQRETESTDLTLPLYAGSNPHVLRMREFLLQDQFNKAFVGVYVHGSLATGEEIAYSDFDALVIIKNETLRSPSALARACFRLSLARNIMFAMDPLQHHGWFVIPEYQLQVYPESYLPVAALRDAKTITGDTALKLYPKLNPTHARQFFDAICQQLQRELAGNQFRNNVYQLKSTLSKFFLLPAAYLQARHGRGVSKKESFDIARRELDEDRWRIMDRCSEFREHWQYSISRTQRKALSQTTLLRRMASKRFAPQLNEPMRHTFDDKATRSMIELTEQMQRALDVVDADMQVPAKRAKVSDIT